MGKMFDMDNPVWHIGALRGQVVKLKMGKSLLHGNNRGGDVCTLLLLHDVSVQQGGLHPGRFCAGV